MSKSVNVDFVTRQIEVETDGKEHFISAAMAAKDAEQSMLNAQNAANEVKEIYGDGNFTPLSDLLGSLGTKLKRWGTIFSNKVFASNLPIVYNSVAEMKADTMLWEGMNVKTLGYYEPNDGGGASYIITKDSVADGDINHNLNNGLTANIIIKNKSISFKQCGGKEYDKDDMSNFDNSPLLEKILEKLGASIKAGNKIHKLVFDGKFAFSTPIVVDYYFADIELCGIAQQQAELAWFGKGYLLTFKKNIYACRFHDFSIVGYDLDSCGICHYGTDGMNTTVSLTWFERLSFLRMKSAFWLRKKSGYVHFVGCKFLSNDNTEHLVELGHDDPVEDNASYDNVEYVWFDRCAFEGAYYEGTGLTIHWGVYIWITNCDICNFYGYGINIQNSYGQQTHGIFMRGLSLDNPGIQLNIDTTGFTNKIECDGYFYYNTPEIAPESRVAVIHGLNSTSAGMVNNFSINGACAQSYASAKYGIELSFCSSPYIKITKNCGIIWQHFSPDGVYNTNYNVRVKYTDFINDYISYNFSPSFMGKTDTLTDNSPYLVAPALMITQSKGNSLNIKSINSTNTYKGIWRNQITLGAYPQGDEILVLKLTENNTWTAADYATLDAYK